MSRSKNTSFWRCARRMLRYRKTLIVAGVMAFVSAAGLGVGLVAIVPILNILLEQNASLSEQVTDLADKVNLTIPQAVLDSLPTDRFVAIAWTLAALCGLSVLGATANFLHIYFAQTVSIRTVADIRRDLFRHVLHLPFLETRAAASDAVSRIIADADQLNRGFDALTSKAIAQISKGAIALLAALFINWRITLIALVVAPVVYTVIRKVGKTVRRASRGMLKARSRLLSVASEAIRNTHVVKALRAESEMIGRFTRENTTAANEQLRARTARALATPVTELIAIFMLTGLALFAAQQILAGGLDMTSFLAAMASLGVAGAALKPLTGIVQQVQTSEAGARRICDLFDLALEPVIRSKGAARKPAPPRHRKSIEFVDVHFSYPNADSEAISGIDLSIPHGSKVAFVGPNGSGKSTLLSLVPRLIDPDSGCVLIDGVDTRDSDIRGLRRQIGFVSQDVVLFHASIRDNIRMGMTGATDEQIRDAARRARADAFIQSKNGEFDAMVGEGGVSLSGGQRQRIAIARAIIRDPAIMILDEATSMIDAESEQQITDAVNEFSRGRTCLVIAHRLSTVVNADKIVVLDAGRVADSGTHEELLERCDVYRRICNGQLMPASV